VFTNFWYTITHGHTDSPKPNAFGG